MEQTVSTCPAWCHGKHLPGWRAHSRDVTEIVNEFSGDIVVIAVTQYGDHDPQVSVALDTHHETAVAYLGSAVAAHLGACLRAIGQPGTLADVCGAGAGGGEGRDAAVGAAGVVLGGDAGLRGRARVGRVLCTARADVAGAAYRGCSATEHVRTVAPAAPACPWPGGFPPEVSEDSPVPASVSRS